MNSVRLEVQTVPKLFAQLNECGSLAVLKSHKLFDAIGFIEMNSVKPRLKWPSAQLEEHLVCAACS